MSGVRMCDDCGTVFSQNADGVSTGVIIDNESGKQLTLDYCDICTELKHKVRSNLGFMRRAANSVAELRGANVDPDSLGAIDSGHGE